MSEPDGTEPGAFVLGFDGVPWNLIERWASEGELPAFASLFEEGASGPLASTTPASTPLAWPSIATGRRPDGHGCYWFRQLERDYSHSVVTSAGIRGPHVWDLVTPASVANVPMTYPAREIDGTMVTGMMTPSKGSGFTHPPELADELAERIPDYRIGLDWQRFDGDADAFVREIDSLVDSRERLLEYLLNETTFRLGFVVFTAPDRLQHLVWDEETILEHYKRLDRVLATVREYTERRGSTLFVVSDHGFGPVDRVVSVNRVLEREGLLARRSSDGTRGMLARLGVDKKAVRGWLDRVGIDDDSLVESLPQGLVDMVAMQVPGDNAVYDIDYADSSAFVRGHGSVYVNRRDRFDAGTVAPEEVPALKRRMRELFESVTDPETGERVLEVYDGDDLFPDDPESPDLVVEGVEGYLVQVPLTDAAVVDAERAAAGHRPEGILFATGPDVAPGAAVEGANVTDVLPTLLHAIDEPIPSTVDGEVLWSVFADGSDAAARGVRTSTVTEPSPSERAAATTVAGGGGDAGSDADDDDDGSVEARLRGLGYIE
ncbi:alkaline phosphatase family protein [Halobaculum lipolyticum]|uniref:Alkaline phosphatase family protein n=1 Tax=Halobaculum lipolyticum TaxID=3032001 RepID=A0ABD5W6A2_9EURY|nr:alkaline phosphatase family protein [Halobaculum sp. DT31]